jgi:hypothetical protein
MKYVKIVEDAFTPLMGNVTCGQFFKYNGNLCVRISKNTSGQWEAYDFVTQDKIWVPFTDRVLLVDCKVEYKYIDNPKD